MASRFNIPNQIMSSLKLPAQMYKTAISNYSAYMLKKQLQVRQNQLNPQYGNPPVGTEKFNMKKVQRAADSIF